MYIPTKIYRKSQGWAAECVRCVGGTVKAGADCTRGRLRETEAREERVGKYVLL